MSDTSVTGAPADAEMRRAAKPLVCYQVDQLPDNNLALYRAARNGAELIDEVIVPPRDGRCFDVPAGCFFRIVSVDGPQVGDLNLWNRHDLSERFFSGKTRQLHATHIGNGDRLWSTLPGLRPLATIVQDTLDWYKYPTTIFRSFPREGGNRMISTDTLILGIGNTLLTDEGAGIHALNLLQSEYTDIPHVTFLDGGTLSFTLATWIEDCDNLIVFDAAEFHLPVGTVKTLVGADMDSFLGASRRSAHEVGLLDLIDIARLTESLPAKRALIGIQAAEFGWGMQPCEAVQRALPVAVDEARKLIELWNGVDLGQIKNISEYRVVSPGAEYSTEPGTGHD